MKFLLKIFKWFAIVLASIIILMYIFDVDYLLRAVRTIYFKGYTTAFLEDYKEFPNREIKKGVAQPWAIASDYNTIPATVELAKNHKELQTIAYLIIKNDSIWHESYFDGFDENSKSNSFSMAKSIVTMAMGKALMEGKMKSLDQKVTDVFPELKGTYPKEVTIGDLSSMASGLSWDEKYYSPFSIVTRAYFDDDLKNVILNLDINEKPGQSFKYLSGATQLLAMCIEKATGEHLSAYVSKHFWQPMGAENDAKWLLDGDSKHEKAFCCFNGVARDYARFGELMRTNGKWKDKQLVPENYMKAATSPASYLKDPTEGDKQVDFYGYQFWVFNHRGFSIPTMNGLFGQYVYTIREKNAIIVRLGETKVEKHVHHFQPENFTYIDAALSILK